MDMPTDVAALVVPHASWCVKPTQVILAVVSAPVTVDGAIVLVATIYAGTMVQLRTSAKAYSFLIIATVMEPPATVA